MSLQTRLLQAAIAPVALLMAGGSPPTHAQPMNDPFAASGKGKEWAVMAGAGAALRPTYEGSGRYFVTPLPVVSVVWRDMVALDLSGLNAYWRFDGLQVGGGLTFNLGRTQNSGVFSQGDSRLNGLGDIPAALGFRGFVNYRLGPVMLGTALTKFVADGNNGLLIDASIGVPWRIDDRLMVMGRLFTTWADSSYTQTYFGVTATQSANSGYAIYSAGSGFKNVGLAVGATYRLTTSWTVSANAQVTQLLDYAAGSPITFSDTGIMLITTLGYRF
jgi:outer membrane protein